MSTSPTILVTGGAGYIGAHACKALAGDGFLPICLDDLSSGQREAVRWGPLEVGRIQDSGFLDAVLARWRPVGALHFAASISVAESVSDPLTYWTNNVGGTLSVLAAMRKAGMRHIVLSSTAAVYGSSPVEGSLSETAPLAPDNPYGQTKRAAEAALADCARAHGMQATALRYFNAAGGDPEGEIGESHDPETHLIPLAIDAALGRRGPLSVFGTDYPTPDGTAVRDYIHVDDLVTAHILALRRMMERPKDAPGSFTAYNLGSGEGASVLQVLRAVEAVLGRAVPHHTGPRRAGDSPVLVAAIDKARAELGWSPAHSDLHTIVRDAALWRARGTGSAAGR